MEEQVVKCDLNIVATWEQLGLMGAIPESYQIMSP